MSRKTLTVSGSLFLALVLRLTATADDSRIESARAELEAARATLKEVTTPRETELWERKVAILEQEIRNAQRLQVLEKKEKQHARFETKSDQQILLEAISAISPDVNDLEALRASLNREIQQLVMQRSRIEQQLEGKAPETDEQFDQVADLEQQRKNSDADILAKTFQLNALDLSIRIRLDAAALRKETAIAAGSQPTPTLRMVVRKIKDIREAGSSRDYYDERQSYFKGQREQAAVRLELAQERSNQASAEYDLLRDRIATEKRTSTSITNATERAERQRRLSRMLSSARSEMRLLQPRIAHLQDQVRRLDEAGNLSAQGVDLFDKAITYLQGDYQALRKEYFARMALLLSIIAGLVLLELIVEHLFLPHLVRKESLFISKRMGRYVTALLILVVVTFFFFEDLRSVATILGLATAAVVIALQDLCSSFVGWFIIALSKKVKVGDRVEINGIVGDIVDIQMLRTTLLECRNWLGTDDHTGRTVVVPNNFILKGHLYNYTFMHPMLWHRLDITVTFESPPEETRDLLKQILEEEAKDGLEAFRKDERRLNDHFDLTCPQQELKVLCIIADSGITFSLFYPVHYLRCSSFKSRLSQRIVQEFAKRPRIQFAYPTQRHIPTPEAGGLPVQLTQRAP